MSWFKSPRVRTLFLVYCLLILAGSSIPSHSMPKLVWLTKDKLLHCGEYSLFGFLYFLTWRYTGSPAWLWAVPILFPGLDESWQHFIPGRDPSVYDALADWLGIAIGLVIGYFFLRHDRANSRS